MGKNTYLNVAVTVLGLLFLVVVVILVNALDSLRFAVEDLKKIKEQPVREVTVIRNGGLTEETFSSATLPERPEAANRKYFDPASVSGGRLLTAFGADVGNMNMLINNDSYVSRVWAYVNDTLAERDLMDGGDGKYQPKMAVSWKVSEDKLRWRISLRKGILWHDFVDPVTGKKWEKVPVTAHDFKFYVDVVKNKEVDAVPLRSYLADLDRIEVFDDFEFDVVWSKPYFLSEDITLSLSPLPRHLYHADGGVFSGKKFNDDHKRNRMIVGCGPYRFDRWEKGKRIVLRRFEEYYGKDLGIMPPLQTIAFDIIQHPNTRLQALLAGDLDLEELTPDQWINRTSSKEFAPGGMLKKMQSRSFAYNYIGLNQKNPLFKDKKVRQALSYLVNREKLLKDIYFDLADIVTGPFAPGTSACDPAIKPYPFDIAKAAAMLDELGWKDSDGDGIRDKQGKKLSFTVVFPGSSTLYRKMLPVIREDMAKAGVRMELLGIEWSVLVKRLENKEFDACALGWTGTLKPDPFQLWHSSLAHIPASSNHCAYSNPAADRLIEQIRLTFDGRERTRLYHEFHRTIYSDAPYIFLFAPRKLMAIHSRYRNVRIFRDSLAKELLWVPASRQKNVP
ncbi:MAG: hypothetical protein IKA79_06140 [Lentisphaeria bacterium]|nr:hypothetical protein [Lentisphaeria bacterium]